MPRRRIAAIAYPAPSLPSVTSSVLQLKEAVETMSGANNKNDMRVAWYDELVTVSSDLVALSDELVPISDETAALRDELDALRVEFDALFAEYDAGIGSVDIGMVASTDVDTFAARTITGTSGQIIVTDGDGVSGDPTIEIANDLSVPGSVTAGTVLNASVHLYVSGNDGTDAIITSDGRTNLNRKGDTPLSVNRDIDDGTLIALKQNDTTEGSITVSGTTVAFNGAHLSRWSQWATDYTASDPLLRGTILANVDEKCVWPGEDNEQLNRVVVSSTVNDPNVGGVFDRIDVEDNFGDLLLASRGDFMVRISSGVTVNRGDLLVSAGDGTAMAMDMDAPMTPRLMAAVIGKVMSVEKTTTYSDGSYLVPAML